MTLAPQGMLVGAVAAVGVLHTVVPDHWVPITLLARQRGWSPTETARAAFTAGAGHVASTLLIAVVVWIAGAAVAARFGALVDGIASAALIAFGGWIAVAAWRELHREAPPAHPHHQHGHRHGHSHTHGPVDGGHGHPHHHHAHDADGPQSDPLYAPLRAVAADAIVQHSHLHRHGRGVPHLHWHDHAAATAHAVSAVLAIEPPLHDHLHRTTARTALLLILGSSPMVEGIPAFFAAGQYGASLIAVMATVFALATIATYVVLSVLSTAGLQRVRLGPFERYGEILSGSLIAVVGVAFWMLSAR